MSVRKICSFYAIKKIMESKKHFRAKNFVYTAHELFHIKYIYDIKKFVSLTKNSIICEIGPGYGSMIAKLKKKYNSKIILIDLPEANFISHYYLKLIFPKKNFSLAKILKNVSKNDILKMMLLFYVHGIIFQI